MKGDQRMPESNGGERVAPFARDEFLRMLERQIEVGEERYGKMLETFNGRDALRDAMEELIDAWQYLCQIRLEREARFKPGYEDPEKNKEPNAEGTKMVRGVFINWGWNRSMVKSLIDNPRGLTKSEFMLATICNEWMDEVQRLRKRYGIGCSKCGSLDGVVADGESGLELCCHNCGHCESALERKKNKEGQE